MSEKQHTYALGKNAYIINSSGVAPEAEQMKVQADYSYALVRQRFTDEIYKVLINGHDPLSKSPNGHNHQESTAG